MNLNSLALPIEDGVLDRNILYLVRRPHNSETTPAHRRVWMNTGNKEPIMAAMLNHEQKGILDDQLFALRDKTVNGVRDFNEVRKALQNIIEGKFITVLPGQLTVQTHGPSWYVLPEQQLERVKQLNEQRGWGFAEADFPKIPSEFMPQTPTEVLLLAVYLPNKGRRLGLHRTFDDLWNLIEAPDGYTKHRWYQLKATTKLLRQAPGYDHTPGIRWMAFDPNTYHDTARAAALEASKHDGFRLAGTEVLMAALLFPTWSTSWSGGSSPFPNLSGLQFYWDSGWSGFPYLARWDGPSQLMLRVGQPGDPYGRWSRPSVREC